MAKKNIGRSFNIYPMPVVIVGTVTDGKPNFMTAAWITKLHYEPPLVGIALGRKHREFHFAPEVLQFFKPMSAGPAVVREKGGKAFS